MNSSGTVWTEMAHFVDSVGTGTVFGIPSDDLGILEALEGQHTQFILAKDQRNAVFMAAGYALTSRQLGLCFVGKGPAVTNALTGVLECRASCAPVMVVAVGTARGRVGARAFQELDQVAIMKPLTKWAYRVEHPDRLVWAIERAAYLAVSDCPGPTYLEIPEDLAGPAPIPNKSRQRACQISGLSTSTCADAIAFIVGLRRPLFLFGGGALNVSRKDWYEELANAVGAAVFVTASGRGSLREDHPLFCGLAGLYTSKALRALWEECDGVVCFGSRLEETATLLMNAERLRAKVLQVNITGEEMSSTFDGPQLVGRCDVVAEQFCRSGEYHPDEAWLEMIAERKADALALKRECLTAHKDDEHIHMSVVMDELARALPSNAILVQENGLADMWSYFYPYYSLTFDQISIVPSEQTSLGFGVTAAIGAKAAKRDCPVVALVGDGAFNMGRADIATSAAYSLPVVYIVLNNGGFGWLQHQWQRRNHHGRPLCFESDLRVNVTGVHHFTIKHPNDLREQLPRAFACNQRGETAIVEIQIKNLVPAPGVEDFDSL